MDALDAYMSAIKSGVMDTKTKMKLKRQLLELKKEEQKLQRMVNVAKPAALPDLKRFKISYIYLICQLYGSCKCNTCKSENYSWIISWCTVYELKIWMVRINFGIFIFSSSTEKAKTDKASLTFSRLRKPVGNTKPKVIIVLFVCINLFFIYLHKCQSTMFI